MYSCPHYYWGQTFLCGIDRYTFVIKTFITWFWVSVMLQFMRLELEVWITFSLWKYISSSNRLEKCTVLCGWVLMFTVMYNSKVIRESQSFVIVWNSYGIEVVLVVVLCSLYFYYNNYSCCYSVCIYYFLFNLIYLLLIVWVSSEYYSNSLMLLKLNCAITDILPCW